MRRSWIAKYGVAHIRRKQTMQMINGYMRETAGANVMARHAGADVLWSMQVRLLTLYWVQCLKFIRRRLPGVQKIYTGPAIVDSEQAEKHWKLVWRSQMNVADKGYNY